MNFDKSVVCPVLIGRDYELLLLEGLMTQAQAGKGQIALISGEAGIGKSRLVREAKARAPHENSDPGGILFSNRFRPALCPAARPISELFPYSFP